MISSAQRCIKLSWLPVAASASFAFAFLAIVTAAQNAASAKQPAAKLRAGAAEVDITPPPGVSMNGVISRPGPITGVHDRIFARALVLDDGALKLAIVVCDLCIVDQDTFDLAKQRVAELIKLPMNRMLISATHTHAAPRVPFGRVGPDDDQYYAVLVEKIAQAVVRAEKNLAPANIGWTSFQKPEYVKCRRSLCKPGSVGPNPFGEAGEQVKSVAGKGGVILEPAGPVDPEFSIISVRHQDGAPLAVLGNYSVHYCGGYQRGLVSADYFGAYSRWLRKNLPTGDGHPPVVAMMSNGTSGNTGAIQGVALGRRPPFERIDLAGRALAEQTLRLLDGIAYRQDVSLDMAEKRLELGVRRPDAKRLAWAEAVLAQPKNAKQIHPWTRIYAGEALALSKLPPTVSLKLQALRIGDLAIVGIPCEPFAETGLAIKAASPMSDTIVMGLANGEFGYLPPPRQHALGGYETWPARSSSLETEAEPKIRRVVSGLLQSVTEKKH